MTFFLTHVKNLFTKKALKVTATLTGIQLAFDCTLVKIREDSDESQLKFEDTEFVGAVLVAPPLEELVYRLPLVTTSWFGSIIYSIDNLHRIYIQARNLEIEGIPKPVLTGMGVIGAIAQTSVFAHLTSLKYLPRYVPYTRGLLYVCTSISFGSIHIYNYKEANKDALINIGLYQTISGFNLGYLALKYGLQYSILGHALFNLSIWGLSKLQQIES